MVLDFIEILKVIFLGIVEGITEWLPISSTGHMILVDEFITLNMSEAFKEMFFVVIQLGAILAVVVMFWNKMFPFQFKNKAQSIVKKDTFSLWFKVAVACVPSAIMGILFDDYLDAYLQTPIVISIMLIFYGLLFILIENWNKKRKVRRHIIGGLGDKRMADVSLDDIQLALVPVSKKSASVYKSVVILCKSIFRAAKESHVIDEDPTIYLDAKGGVPQEERQALTDEQVERLLDTIRDLPPYVFVMIGLYAGLRREEILALQWDSVYLDAEAPYLTVRRAWHTEHNRPVILTELKTKAAQRNIPLPVCLVECLKDAKKKSTSDYVIANRDGDPLSYTQFKRLWQYIVTRTAKPRMARKLVDGKYVKYMLYPKLGEKARNNGHVVYSLDFEVTPHQLRHTYITNLIHSSVDPKTVQYLAGHESSKITMDIYAKVKYNRPDDLVKAMGCAFDLWDAV